MGRPGWPDIPPSCQCADGRRHLSNVVGGASVRPDSAVVRTGGATVPTQGRVAAEALIGDALER
jgi:hypothetical protein